MISARLSRWVFALLLFCIPAKLSAAVPGKAGLPHPVDKATGVSANVTLTWTAALGAISYDVSFGTSNPPFTVVLKGLTTFSYQPTGALTAGTTYYWQVTANNYEGATPGDVWSFVVSSSPAAVAGANGNSSNFDAGAFELLTGVGAVLAGANYTSYNVDNDVLKAANIGRKTPEILLGGAFILPWKKGGGRISRAYCGKTPAGPKDQSTLSPGTSKTPKDQSTPSPGSSNCVPYDNYRPWETFLSFRFAPGTDQTLNGFTVGGGYKITKYFSLLIGYAVSPVNEPSPGFRIAAAGTVQKYPTIAPYNQYNPSALLNNTPGAFDGFPTLLYDATGPTAARIFLGNPTVTHFRSGIFFGIGIPVNLGKLFGTSSSK